ncbi:MAG: DUF1254 domain-containing protein [Ahrensia sp.]|nr:DUF1254 domain-containing protein [Ahrensia sp.]
MRKVAYTLVLTVLAAGIVHLAVILLVPSFASRDAWAQLSSTAGRWSFNTIAKADRPSEGKARPDTAMGIAACLFNLNEAPVRVEAGGDLPFWSVAVFDRLGQNIYSFNDRTAIENELLMLIVDPVQRARLRKSPVEELDQAIIIESTSPEGFVLLRALQMDDSWAPKIAEFLANATCERYDIPEE